MAKRNLTLWKLCSTPDLKVTPKMLATFKNLLKSKPANVVWYDNVSVEQIEVDDEAKVKVVETVKPDMVVHN